MPCSWARAQAPGSAHSLLSAHLLKFQLRKEQLQTSYSLSFSFHSAWLMCPSQEDSLCQGNVRPQLADDPCSTQHPPSTRQSNQGVNCSQAFSSSVGTGIRALRALLLTHLVFAESTLTHSHGWREAHRNTQKSAGTHQTHVDSVSPHVRPTYTVVGQP